MRYPYFNFGPEFQEKQKIRKTANCMGGAYALMSLVSVSIGLLLGTVLGYFGVSAVKLQEALNDHRIFDVFQIFVSLIMFVPIYIIGAKINGSKLFKICEYKRPKKELFIPLVLFGIGVCKLAEWMASLFYGCVETVGIEPNMSDIPMGRSFTGILLSFVTIAVVPAFVEEFAMRGIVLGSFRFIGDGSAIFISSLLFAFMHGNLVQIPFAFTVGMALGFIAVKSGSVWTAAAVHFMNNFISTAVDYLAGSTGQNGAMIISAAVSIVMISAGFIGLFMSLSKDKDLLRLNKCETIMPERQALKTALSAPLMIAAYVLTAISVAVTTFGL